MRYLGLVITLFMWGVVLVFGSTGYADHHTDDGDEHHHHHDEDGHHHDHSKLTAQDAVDYHKLHVLEGGLHLEVEVSGPFIMSSAAKKDDAIVVDNHADDEHEDGHDDDHKTDKINSYDVAEEPHSSLDDMHYYVGVSYGKKLFDIPSMISIFGGSISGSLSDREITNYYPQLSLYVKPYQTYIQHSEMGLDFLGYDNKTFDLGSVLSYLKLGVNQSYILEEDVAEPRGYQIVLHPEISFQFEHGFDPLGLVPILGGKMYFYGGSNHLWSVNYDKHPSHGDGGSSGHAGHHHQLDMDQLSLFAANLDNDASHESSSYFSSPQLKTSFTHTLSFGLVKFKGNHLISLLMNNTMAQQDLMLSDDVPTFVANLVDSERGGYYAKQHIDLYYEYLPYGLITQLSLYKMDLKYGLRYTFIYET